MVTTLEDIIIIIILVLITNPEVLVAVGKEEVCCVLL